MNKKTFDHWAEAFDFAADLELRGFEPGISQRAGEVTVTW